MAENSPDPSSREWTAWVQFRESMFVHSGCRPALHRAALIGSQGPPPGSLLSNGLLVVHNMVRTCVMISQQTVPQLVAVVLSWYHDKVEGLFVVWGLGPASAVTQRREVSLQSSPSPTHPGVGKLRARGEGNHSAVDQEYTPSTQTQRDACNVYRTAQQATSLR